MTIDRGNSSAKPEFSKTSHSDREADTIGEPSLDHQANSQASTASKTPSQTNAASAGGEVARSGHTGAASLTPTSSVSSLVAALGYIIWFIVPILALSSRRADEFTRIHSYQGITFAGLSIGSVMASAIITLATGGLLAPLLLLAILGPPVLSLLLAYRTYTLGQTEFAFLSDTTRSFFEDRL
jgi:uncharacterized membrane protein